MTWKCSLCKPIRISRPTLPPNLVGPSWTYLSLSSLGDTSSNCFRFWATKTPTSCTGKSSNDSRRFRVRKTSMTVEGQLLRKLHCIWTIGWTSPTRRSSRYSAVTPRVTTRHLAPKRPPSKAVSITSLNNSSCRRVLPQSIVSKLWHRQGLGPLWLTICRHTVAGLLSRTCYTAKRSWIAQGQTISQGTILPVKRERIHPPV